MKSNENNTQALCDCPQSYLCSSVFMWPWGERGMVVRGTYAIYTSFLLFHSVSLSESFKSIMMHRMRQGHHNELHLFFAASVYTVDATLCSCEHRPTMLHAVHKFLDWRKIHYDFLKNPIDILYRTVIGLIMPTMEARFAHPACFAFCRISKVLIFPEKCQCYEVPPRFTPSSALRHQRTESSESLLEDCAQVENNAAALSYAAISPAAKKPRPSL